MIFFYKILRKNVILKLGKIDDYLNLKIKTIDLNWKDPGSPYC